MRALRSWGRRVLGRVMMRCRVSILAACGVLGGGAVLGGCGRATVVVPARADGRGTFEFVRAPAVPEAVAAKPAAAYEKIERVMPPPYLELFARAPRPMWTSWGNQIAGFEGYTGSIYTDDAGAAEEQEHIAVAVTTDATAPPEALHRSRTQIEQARAIHLYLTELQTAGNGHRGFNVRSEYIGRKSVR